MSSIGLPSQGFLNFLIFIRPRYVTSRRRHPDNTRIRTLLRAIWYPTGQKHHQEQSSCVFCERLVYFIFRTKPSNNESDWGNSIAPNGDESAHGDTNAALQECGKDIRDMDPSSKNRSMLDSLSPVEDVEVDDYGDNNKTVVKETVDTNGRAKKKDFFWESGHFDAETRLEANDDVDNENDTWMMF
jgi:hypothetical protein